MSGSGRGLGKPTIEIRQGGSFLLYVRKWALNALKVYETGKKAISIRMKRFMIGTNPEKHLENILNL